MRQTYLIDLRSYGGDNLTVSNTTITSRCHLHGKVLASTSKIACASGVTSTPIFSKSSCFFFNIRSSSARTLSTSIAATQNDRKSEKKKHKSKEKKSKLITIQDRQRKKNAVCDKESLKIRN